MLKTIRRIFQAASSAAARIQRVLDYALLPLGLAMPVYLAVTTMDASPAIASLSAAHGLFMIVAAVALALRLGAIVAKPVTGSIRDLGGAAAIAAGLGIASVLFSQLHGAIYVMAAMSLTMCYWVSYTDWKTFMGCKITYEVGVWIVASMCLLCAFDLIAFRDWSSPSALTELVMKAWLLLRDAQVFGATVKSWKPYRTLYA